MVAGKAHRMRVLQDDIEEDGSRARCSEQREGRVTADEDEERGDAQELFTSTGWAGGGEGQVWLDGGHHRWGLSASTN